MFGSDSSSSSTASKRSTGNVTPNLSAENTQSSEAYAKKMTEGPVARAIEKRTAQLPSDIFLWAALGSIGLSLTLQLTGRRQPANFVGHWAPTFLTLGLYNKLVKVAGHDRVTE
jgi:hypothetical protein